MGTHADITDYLDRYRPAVAEEITRLFDHRDREAGDLYSLVMDYPLREGKGLRPTLAIAACRAVGGEVGAVLPSAATLELYHNAFLIHDDVEDDSILRRGEPTLHAAHGVPVAINVGDAMLCLSLQPLLDNIEVVGLGEAIRILREIATMTQRTVEGQASELRWIRNGEWDLDDDDYIRMVEHKTGWYSFITPVRVGLICGAAPAATRDQLTTYARHLSVAFQITDDVLNLAGEIEDYGKEIGGDLWEGKRTMVLLAAMRSMTDEQRTWAVDLLSRSRPGAGDAAPLIGAVAEIASARGLSAGDVEAISDTISAHFGRAKTHPEVAELHRLIVETGALDYATARARQFADLARRALEDADLPDSDDGVFLSALVDYVVERAA